MKKLFAIILSVAMLLSFAACGGNEATAETTTEVMADMKQGEKLDSLAMRRGQASSSRGFLFLILSFFGLGMVAYALMQDSLNKLE